MSNVLEMVATSFMFMWTIDFAVYEFQTVLPRTT